MTESCHLVHILYLSISSEIMTEEETLQNKPDFLCSDCSSDQVISYRRKDEIRLNFSGIAHPI